MPQLSKAEKLLVAAGRLVAGGKFEFSSEDLVVSAFKAFPDDFSMKGYPQYPDSNPVLTQIMGIKAPLIVRGWIEKVGIKKYRLTPKGLDDINELQGGQGVAVEKLDRLRDEEMGSLLTSAAFELAREGNDSAITFYQFCRFVGLTASDSWQAVQGKLSHALHIAEEAERIGQSGRILRLFVKGKNMSFEPEELLTVKPLLADLTERFKVQMDEWRRNASV